MAMETTKWVDALCEFPGDRPALVTAEEEPRSLTLLVLRYFFREGSVAEGAKDLDLPIVVFEKYLRGGIATLLGQAFDYRVPTPANRSQSSFELDAEKLWREIQQGAYRMEPQDEHEMLR